MMQKSLVALCGALLLALSSGCSSTADLVESELLQTPLEDFRALQLEVVSLQEQSESATDSERTAASVARRRFQVLLALALRDTDVFREVNTKPSETPAKHRLEIVMQPIEGPSYFWQTVLGFMAPRTVLTVQGRWVARSTEGEEATQGGFTATGSSARGVVYSGGFEEAARACSKRIATYVSRRRK